ncbi:zinc-binding alcohol dehydrogenase family protein [Phytohabitans sp. ZYX-F-186]|uniref:alcohol dehydrogenase n=1 Tax=Phytohabitans maris TaxID=3071409 RepID=A0ABU0ZQL5_9ACTN|nr:zinc-binding alcohol dehydrogenase family protein [Phytohabitans sp. ZYX-F-186]MDQ7909315.1 zinc-binding alcohol dehydrogenase family protein [Phytohabitans sp. ZYX-F-186]
MLAWEVRQPGPMATTPLHAVVRPRPEPGVGELLLRVRACAVCRTDLHVAEGDLPVHRPHVTPGHEIVGEVVALGPGVGEVRSEERSDEDGPSRPPGLSASGASANQHSTGVEGFREGERVGVAWLRHTCGRCVYCLRGAENLCPESRYTGWDADGGYAEYTVAPAAYVYRLPDRYSDAEVAPLLCAGIIGFRALRRADLPPGGRLGVYGFGASAHLATQVALAQGARVHVLTRAAAARELALDLGVASVAGAYDAPPEPLDAAILFAPVGDLVPVALAALDRGGTLAVAGIHLTDIPSLDYERHLFQERQLRSVTANTRADGRDFLAFAAGHRLRVTTAPYPLQAADTALADLAGDRVNGAAVLVP